MTPQPPERISFILLKSFIPGSFLFIPWGSDVGFRKGILWCLCCCNGLRFWGDAGRLVYIPVFSLVQVHHQRIAHMRHLSTFAHGEDHLWTFRLRDGQRQVLFSGVDGLLRRGCLFSQCRLFCAGTCSRYLAERVRGQPTRMTCRRPFGGLEASGSAGPAQHGPSRITGALCRPGCSISWMMNVGSSLDGGAGVEDTVVPGVCDRYLPAGNLYCLVSGCPVKTTFRQYTWCPLWPYKLERPGLRWCPTSETGSSIFCQRLWHEWCFARLWRDRGFFRWLCWWVIDTGPRWSAEELVDGVLCLYGCTAGTRVRLRGKSEIERAVQCVLHTASSPSHRPTGQGGAGKLTIVLTSPNSPSYVSWRLLGSRAYMTGNIYYARLVRITNTWLNSGRARLNVPSINTRSISWT